MLGAINPPKFTVSEEQLIQYGAMGTIIHKMAEFSLQGETNPTKLWQECKKEWDIIQNGDLGLDPSAANPQGFMQKYADEFDWSTGDIEVEMIDNDLMMKGTADLPIKRNGRWVMADWKTCRSYSREKKEHYFKQLALYSIMYQKQTGREMHELVILPLNPNNKAGYGKPIITDEVDKYKALALKDLDKFNKLYRK